MLRKILVFISVIIVYVLHTTLAPYMELANVVPNFTMVFVCCYSLLRGKREGMIVGLFSGLLLNFAGVKFAFEIGIIVFVCIVAVVGFLAYCYKSESMRNWLSKKLFT